MKKKIGMKTAVIFWMTVLLVALPLLGACTKEVVKEVPVERVVEKEVVKEVVKEVPVEKVVEKVVVKEVPVEKVVVKTVEKEVIVEGPKPKGELRVAISAIGSEVLDPILARSSDKWQMNLIYDPLVGNNPDMSLSKETGVAEDWEMSADTMTWTFYIRKGIKFHNGDELTAEDVKFSLERMVGDKSITCWTAELQKIEKMEVPDPYTLVLHLKEPSPMLDFNQSHVVGCGQGYIMPKSYIERVGDEYFGTHPIGSGPYKIAEHVLGSYMAFEAQDRHWRAGVPQYHRIVLQAVPEEAARIGMLKRGETDATEITRRRAKELEGAGFGIHRMDGATVVYLRYWVNGPGVEETPMGNKKVREALTMAIDREAILNTIFGGFGNLTYATIPSAHIGFSQPEPIPYDPERAKQLLAEAGYAEGFDLDFYNVSWGAVGESKELAEAVVGYWDRIGVKIKMIPIDYSAYRPKWWEGELQNSVSWIISSMAPWKISTQRLLYHSERWTAGPNIPALIDELEPLIEQAEVALTQKEREELVGKINEFHREHHLEGPLLEIARVFAASKEKITDWEFYGRMDMNLEYLFTGR